MPRGHYFRKPKPEQDPPRVDPPLSPHRAPVPKAPPPPPSLADGFCAALAASTAKDVAELDAKIKQLEGTLESYRMLRDLLAAKHGLPLPASRERELDLRQADHFVEHNRALREIVEEQPPKRVTFARGDLVRYRSEEWEVAAVRASGMLDLEKDDGDGTVDRLTAVRPTQVTLIKSFIEATIGDDPEPIIAGKPLTEVLIEEGLEDEAPANGVKLTVEQRRANVVAYLRNQPDNSVPRAALFRLKIVPPSLSRVILEHPWFVVDRLGQISLTPLGAQEGP